MRSRTLLSLLLGTAALLALAIPCASAGTGGSNATPSDPRTQNLYPLGSASEYAYLGTGQNAPDFHYDAADGSDARLHDLLAQGHVLLVFGAGDERLRAIERERTALLRMGVVPVAVLDLGGKTCRAAVTRLGLHYPVIADPRRVIAAQFNCLESSTRATAPAWFVVDRKDRLRACDRFEWPQSSWTITSASALGLPVGDALMPTSSNRP
jgi:peroxiredoxin